MRTKVFLMLLLALALAACSVPGGTEPATEPEDASNEVESTAEVVEEAEATPEESGDGCPKAQPGTEPLTNEKHGYCLLYPTGYSITEPNPNETVLTVGGLLDVEHARLHITFEESGPTAEEAAEQMGADFTGFDLLRSETTIGGEPATVLDMVPGQMLSRYLLVAHEGRLYRLMFAPADADAGEAFEQMEALYQTVVDSFRFIPVSESATAGEADPQAACPEATPGTYLLIDQANGYCLLYPAEYDVFDGEAGVTLYVNSLLDVEHPKLSVEVADAAGRDINEAAEEFLAGYEGFDLQGTFGLTVNNAPAVEVERVPGQDLQRVLLFIHDGRIFTLRFSPDDEQMGDTFLQMERLYATVFNSFTFIPVDAGAPLLAGPECPEAGEGTELLRNEAGGYCLLYPTGFTAEQTSENETNLFVGSMQDVQHPKLFIQSEDVAGRDLQQVTDAVTAELASALPDQQPEMSFGLMVDGSWANVFHHVPGQDLGRQVVFVHNDRLYKLTFVPDDESQGEVYQEMEALYELVIDSFSFLRES